MGEFDDLAAKYGVASKKNAGPVAAGNVDDEFADLAKKYVKVDAGPAARRAAGGGSPSKPRELTSEEAGLSAGPEVTRSQSNTPFPGVSVTTEQAPAPADAPPTDYVTRKPTPGGGEMIRAQSGNPNEMADPLVQMGTATALGMGAGAIPGEIAGAVGAPAAVVRGANAAGQAVESGTANKALGGDFTTGALLTAGPVVKALARGADEAVMGAAPARVAARTQRNLTEPAAKKIADKITKVAGPEGEQLQQVIDRNPELRHALAVQASNRPVGALKVVQKTKAAANATRDASFEAMQAHYADLPASAQASIPQMLDDYKALAKQSLGDRERQGVLKDAHKELIAFADDLRGAQGLPPAVNGDYSGTIVSPKDLRDFEQTVGSRAFANLNPQGAAAVRARVGAELYKPIAKQVNSLAENTPGLDAKKFAQTGQDIHVLIPVEESLQAQVDKINQGKKNFFERVKENAHHIATLGGIAAGTALHDPTAAMAVPAAIMAAKLSARVVRGIDYRLAEAQLARLKKPPAPARAPLPAIAPAAAGAAAAAPQRDMMPTMIPAVQ